MNNAKKNKEEANVVENELLEKKKNNNSDETSNELTDFKKNEDSTYKTEKDNNKKIVISDPTSTLREKDDLESDFEKNEGRKRALTPLITLERLSQLLELNLLSDKRIEIKVDKLVQNLLKLEVEEKEEFVKAEYVLDLIRGQDDEWVLVKDISGHNFDESYDLKDYKNYLSKVYYESGDY